MDPRTLLMAVCPSLRKRRLNLACYLCYFLKHFSHKVTVNKLSRRSLYRTHTILQNGSDAIPGLFHLQHNFLSPPPSYFTFFFNMRNTMQKLLPASHWSRQQGVSGGASSSFSYILIFVYIGT